MGKPWPHPTHKYWAFSATVFDVLSLLFSLVGVFAVNWFHIKGGTGFGLFTSNVTCYIEFCSTIPDLYYIDGIYPSIWVHLAGMIFLLGVSLNALCYGILVFVFWPVVFKGNVSRIILKNTMALSVFSAYVKYIGCWLVVSYMPLANKSRLENRDFADVGISTLGLGFMFTACLCEIQTVIGLRVASDVGVKGQPTHLERLENKQDDMRQVLAAKRKSIAAASYIESSKEYQQSIYKNSSERRKTIETALSLNHTEEHRSILRRVSQRSEETRSEKTKSTNK